jgi:hypothetical protein
VSCACRRLAWRTRSPKQPASRLALRRGSATPTVACSGKIVGLATLLPAMFCACGATAATGCCRSPASCATRFTSCRRPSGGLYFQHMRLSGCVPSDRSRNGSWRPELCVTGVCGRVRVLDPYVVPCRLRREGPKCNCYTTWAPLIGNAGDRSPSSAMSAHILARLPGQSSPARSPRGAMPAARRMAVMAALHLPGSPL